MKRVLINFFALAFISIAISCKKHDSTIQQQNVMYEVAGKNYYHVSYLNENNNWVNVDSITTGWRHQQLFPVNIKPSILIYRLGDTNFIDLSYTRIYVGFTKYESIDTSFSNFDTLVVK
jgi:hypothetical protein